MVAKISAPTSLLRVLNYNENKVKKGQADCIYAGNFLQEAGALNFYEKLHRFQACMEQNTRAKTKILHISLNFHPTERFSDATYRAIASAYMEKIGFGEQPFLVYRHEDAAHPHVHIVTTSIRENGKRIDTYNIGRNQSEKARKELERSFGLMIAEGRKQEKNDWEHSVRVQRVQYGKSETRRSIATVLSRVLHQYRFASLAELNAVLRLYRVEADPGSVDSRMHRNKGLLYRLLDADGKPVGVPIKASSIYFNPTLARLEDKFREHRRKKAALKPKTKTAIDWVLHKIPTDFSAFLEGLKEEKITPVLRRNSDGLLYGITFVDHRNHVVFNGSDLGKNYSAKGLKDRLEMSLSPATKTESINRSRGDLARLPVETESSQPNHSDAEELLYLLMRKERNDYLWPAGMPRKKKRQRPKL